jgi:membrane associated rhomboid family serine protease
MISPSNRPAREPIFNLPGVVLASILVLVGIQLLRDLALSDVADLEFILDWAVVPARWAVAYFGVKPEDILAGLAGPGGGADSRFRIEVARYILAEGAAKPWTAVTYAFLHGSWTHVVLNCIWLAAFGTPVARRCGAWRFLVLGLAAAVGGALAHVLVYPEQILPLVGASAGISGMMAAAAWFMFAPAPWLLEGRLADPHERPRETLVHIVRNQRVLIFLAVWFGSNFLFSVLAQPLGLTDASIAWEAHVGGFLVGLVLFPFLDPLDPRQVESSLKRT